MTDHPHFVTERREHRSDEMTWGTDSGQPWNDAIAASDQIRVGEAVEAAPVAEIPGDGEYDFATFDTDVWTVYNYAHHDSAEEYVTMAAGGDRHGELEFDSGISANSWFCEWTNIFERGNYERQWLLFYADAVGMGGDSDKLAGIGQAYLLDVNYDGNIRLLEVRDESVYKEIVPQGEASTSTSTHTYRLEYSSGDVRFFVDGNSKFDVTISDPATEASKFYFKSITGRNSSTNHIGAVTIGGL